jgi:hypothetical protein
MSLKLLEKLIGEVWVYNADFFLLCRGSTVIIFNIPGKMPDSNEALYIYIYIYIYVCVYVCMSEIL